MATESGKQGADLKMPELMAVLESHPQTVRFFQAVRLLERLYPERKPVGVYVSPDAEVVRFSSVPTLSFPASEVHDLTMAEDGPHRMSVNFMGLSAATGALPDPYTEFLLERARAKDRAPAEFFDLFNHRFISLFYRAWEKYRFYIGYERTGAGEDAVTGRILDLLGLGTSTLKSGLEVSEQACLYYAGILSRQIRTVQGLRQILEDYFSVKVEIDEFTGTWNQLPIENRTFLTDSYTVSEKLGSGAVLGDEVWDQSGTMTLRIGPMPFAVYERFLPGADAHGELCGWLRFYGNRNMSFIVRLVLAREEVPALVLGSSGAGAARLGLVSWIKNRPLMRDPDEASYVVC